ncbi:hypothetical protein CDD81_5180 [Ophiocordyceps australis]|uniref:PHD and RING finger domain-containing protein n=1 Tax=Ophiocordyceps australis TaxID=1399860 RepID=A0A2C5YAQ6_9HYPO|nr:hypothetical protein CDD81_5180 [Ophiocordyceps australis]
MSEPEQCIICLEELPRPLAVDVANGAQADATAPTADAHKIDDDASLLDIVAALDGCEHTLHDSCIRSWAQKTNTCPICRNPFHSVRVYNGVDGTALSTYHVEDKKQVAEFDAHQWLAQNPEPEEEERNSLPCPICNSSEREDVLLLCDGCDAAYHTYCLGFHDIPNGDWYCMECADRFNASDDSIGSGTSDGGSTRRQARRRPAPREIRGFHVRTRARLRRARRQARNAEWQGAWGQFSGRLFEMSNLDLDNHDDDEDLEQYRRFQQHDQRELRRWQQRVNIAQRLGAREEFANSIPPQISERLDVAPQPVESRDEIRAWGAFDRVRGTDGVNGSRSRKRRSRSVTASPAEPMPEPERKLKRPRTRRLAAQGEPAASASTSAAAGPSTTRPTPGSLTQSGFEIETPLVSSLLKELEPNATSEDETGATSTPRRWPPDASSPAMSPASSNLSSPRALSTTPPPLPWTNGREVSPTLSLSTYIEPRYPPANYSPSRPASDGGDAEARPNRSEARPLELRQPRPRRPHQVQPRAEVTSPTRLAMTVEEKKSINEIVKSALRPHWRAQKLTTEQYEAINRHVSRKLYDEVKNVSSLDDESRRTWEKRATQEVAQAVAELHA